jgi:hypothetical protein
MFNSYLKLSDSNILLVEFSRWSSTPINRKILCPAKTKILQEFLLWYNNSYFGAKKKYNYVVKMLEKNHKFEKLEFSSFLIESFVIFF